MPRRWIIRTLALALLTLCVAAWVGSYFVWGEVLYVGKTHFWSLALGRGRLLLYDDDSPAPSTYQRWSAKYDEYDATRRAASQRTYDATPYHLLGFAWHPRMPPESQQFEIIPLWFPMTLYAGFLYFLWRKTRPKQKHAAKGFPVELAAEP